MTWFLLSLSSALAWSFADLFAKKALGTLTVPVVAWARVAFPLPLLIGAVAVWGWVPPPGDFWWAMGCALPLEVAAILLHQKALRISPLGLTAPYLAFTPAFMVLTGRWILGEAASTSALWGIFLVVAGGYALQLEPGMSPVGPLRALARERGSLLMLAVAFLFSVTAALGKVAVLCSSPQTFAFTYFLALSVLLGPWAVRSGRKLRPLRWSALVPVGVFGATMILCHFAAIRLAPASYMIAVKRTSLLWSIVLGRVALGERNLGRRLAGGVLMMAGVSILAASP